jgi:HK97 gp10 family phage protein
MGGFSIEVEGLKELDVKLLELGTKEADRIGFDALRAGGEVIQAAIRERAPERPDLPSGTALPPRALAHDIELHLGRDDEGHPAAIVRPGTLTAYVARWVEYGHRMVRGGYSKILKSGRHRGSGKEIGDVPEYPFIRPGYEEAREEAARVACTKLREGIEKAAKK